MAGWVYVCVCAYLLCVCVSCVLCVCVWIHQPITTDTCSSHIVAASYLVHAALQCCLRGLGRPAIKWCGNGSIKVGPTVSPKPIHPPPFPFFRGVQAIPHFRKLCRAGAYQPKGSSCIPAPAHSCMHAHTIQVHKSTQPAARVSSRQWHSPNAASCVREQQEVALTQAHAASGPRCPPHPSVQCPAPRAAFLLRPGQTPAPRGRAWIGRRAG